MPSEDLPQEFVKRLEAIASPVEVVNVARFFRGNGDASVDQTKILGVSIGKIFPVAKEFVKASLAEIEQLLESPYYEVRMGAVSIMDFQARAKSITPADRKALFDLYLRRHDRIDNWDLVDRAAPHVVGEYLRDQPRGVLDKLAKSKLPCERRTAIVSTYAFIRAGDVDDTFRIAGLLIHDADDLVQKAVGSWIREAGKKDPARLLAFLEKHAATMPRVILRYAIEKLEPSLKAKFMAMKPGE
jgi:3-methyladenine DNA glycosylase AlkD